VSRKNNNDEIIVKNGATKLSPQKFTRYIHGCVQNRRRSQKKIYKAFYGHAMIVCNDYADSPEDAAEILNAGFLNIFKQVIKSPVYIIDISFFLVWVRKIMLRTTIEYYRNDNQSCGSHTSTVCV
jgi:RNA polymerase sigma-70 factor (ECF subfamily)